MVNRQLKHFISILIGISGIIYSCSDEEMSSDSSDNLEALPADVGGTHLPFLLGSTKAPLGYYAYLPSSYEEHSANYPLIVFLHGSGEKGNSQSNPKDLDKVLRNGPPKMIEKKTWNPKYPMIVVSPQSQGNWMPVQIHELIGQLINDYRINTKRIYLTGLSMGGFGTFSYIQSYADTGYVAAAVPICGGGNVNRADRFRNVPIWAFHGDADKTVNVSKSIDMVDAINALDSGLVYPAQLTIYPEVGHNSWTRTYDGTGIGTERTDYDAFDQEIYDWFFTYSKKE